ncbi:tubby [Nematocida sp. LUAm3]|nr:tubby [Nematocida sp. LUAm3]KAI5173791.1 tubby [Nematocida sp. LUAm2]KAI5177014.1 tubby [Nematocida sp. LUAm1]
MDQIEGIDIQRIEIELGIEENAVNSNLSMSNRFAEYPEEGMSSVFSSSSFGKIQKGKIVKRRGCLFDEIEFLDERGRLIIMARRSGLGWNIYSNVHEKLAILRGNLFGTHYVLKRLPSNKETCYIRYTGLYTEGGPRSFQVYINPQEASPGKRLSERVKDKTGEYIKLLNKQPYYNQETNSYVLNFNERVTLPSVRNFQIIHPHDTTYITITFGKTNENEYILDYTYPWCAIDAFGVVLSALGIKFGRD